MLQEAAAALWSCKPGSKEAKRVEYEEEKFLRLETDALDEKKNERNKLLLSAVGKKAKKSTKKKTIVETDSLPAQYSSSCKSVETVKIRKKFLHLCQSAGAMETTLAVADTRLLGIGVPRAPGKVSLRKIKPKTHQIFIQHMF